MPSILVQIVMSAAVNTRRQLNGRRLISLRFAYRASPTTITGGGKYQDVYINEAAAIVGTSALSTSEISLLGSIYVSFDLLLSRRSKVSSET